MSDYDEINIPEAEMGGGGVEQQDQGVQPENGQQPNPAQAAPSWNGKEFALKFRGQEVVPDSRDKLINWAQLGYSSEQRAAQLKAREEELTQRSQQLEQLDRLNRAFETNPALKQKIFEFYQQSLVGQQQPQQDDQGQNAPYMQVIQPLAQRIEELSKKWESYEGKQAEEQLKSEVDALKNKYKDVDWEARDVNGNRFIDDVFQHTIKMGGNTSLEAAFRDLYWDQHMNNVKAQTLKELSEKQAAERRGGVVAAGTARQTVKKEPSVANKTWDQIAEEVIASRQ